MKKFLACVVLAATSFFTGTAVLAETVDSIDYETKVFGSNNKIVIESIDDPQVKGVTCHVSYAKTGGLSGDLGLAEDLSRFSIACRQTGQLEITGNYKARTEVSAFDRNIFFKKMKVIRVFNQKNNTLIYLVYSRKLINGSPFNSISTIPLMPWGDKVPVFK